MPYWIDKLLCIGGVEFLEMTIVVNSLVTKQNRGKHSGKILIVIVVISRCLKYDCLGKLPSYYTLVSACSSHLD
jgi:hypothetical protein